jgi:hypothetical protein
MTGGSVTQEMDNILLTEIRQTYDGEVVAARDLDIF